MVCDVVYAIRAPLEKFPPSLYQVQILAENGYKVVVLDTSSSSSNKKISHKNVHRQSVLNTTFGNLSKLPLGIGNLVSAIQFASGVAKKIKEIKPRLVIAADQSAMYATRNAKLSNSDTRVIWHFHELHLSKNYTGGRVDKYYLRYAEKNAKYMDLLVFPDAGRARIYRTLFGCAIEKTVVVMNCPPLLSELPKSKLREILDKFEVDQGSKIVYYQGGIGPDRGFDQLLHSVSYWPTDAVLLAVGPISPEYADHLKLVVSDLGLQKRVFFLGSFPHSELASLAIGADIGVSITLYNVDGNLSSKYSSGASNKRFEYAAIGLPQVSNSGPGLKGIIDLQCLGRTVNAEKPAELGSSIRELVLDDNFLSKMSNNARKLHLSKYNYESEFKPILSRIWKWIG